MQLKEFIKKIKIPKTVIYALPTLIIFTIVLLAYWPGILVSDSMVQWNQTQTGIFDDWHPAYNTIYIAILTKIWNNPGFVLWVQCIIMSITVGYFFSRLDKYYNVNKYLLLVFSVVFAIIPLNFNFAVTLLKDTLYSSFVIMLTAIIIDIINDKNFFDNKFKCAFLLVVELVIALFRHNGIIVVALTGIILILVYRKKIMPYVIFGAWIVIYLLMTSVGFKILNIQKNSYANTYGPVSHIMARMLNTPGVEFTDEEMQILEKYTDVELLKTTYNQYNMDYSINTQKIDALKESGSEYLKFGIKKAMQYPVVVIKHYIKLTSFLYSPVAFDGSYTVGMFTQTDLWVYNEKYPNLNENSKIPTLLPVLKKIENKYQDGTLGLITMRPAIYMYLSIIMVVTISAMKKKKSVMLVVLPTVLNTLSLIPAIPVAMTRYVYATMFGFVCFTVWFIYELFNLIRRKKNEDSSVDTMLQREQNN